MLDNILCGEIEKKTITQIYGPPSVGKTNLCIIAAINYIRKGYKVTYIDTEGGLSTERIRQISKDNNEFKNILNNLIIYEPESFEEQYRILKKLENIDNIGAIVIDGISSLYRLELSDDINKNAKMNRIMGKQILLLNKLSKKNNSAVLITNQVTDTINGYKAAGGRVLEYWSKIIIRLDKYGEHRKMKLEKHRNLPEGLYLKYKIINCGIKKI